MAAGTLIERFTNVCERVKKAVAASGRSLDDVRLMAVSKIHPAADVAELTTYWQGIRHDLFTPLFGENYVQEALQKQDDVAKMLPADKLPEWHYIGTIQSRKAKEVAGRFALIHSVDSLRLATRINNAMGEGGVQPILVQVNVGREEQKSGVMPEDLNALLLEMKALPHIRVEGLMCLPPFFDDGEASRPFFVALRTLRDEAVAATGLALPHLSMGMSHDMEVAIAEGATIIRIGTDIFGPRPPKEA